MMERRRTIERGRTAVKKEPAGKYRRGALQRRSAVLTRQIIPKVVAAIPCYNTEPFIRDVVVGARAYVDQVIVIDDGSSDGTAIAARAAGALVKSHSANRGYGEAIKSCFEMARAAAADVLVILDGDKQHNPDEIPRLLAPILNEEADLTIGSRFPQVDDLSREHYGSQETRTTTTPRYRAFGIKVITGFWNFGSATKISDAQSGFRAYSKNAFQGLFLSETGMSISIEILEEIRRRQLAITEVPISCQYTESNISFKAVEHGLTVLFSVLRIRWQSWLRSLWNQGVTSPGFRPIA